MGFSRQGYWSGLPFPSPGDLPNPETELRSPKLQVDSLPSEPLGKLLCSLRIHEYILEHSMYFSPILTLVSWLKRLIALTAFFVSCLAVIEFPSVPSRDSEMKIWEGMKILLCRFHGPKKKAALELALVGLFSKLQRHVLPALEQRTLLCVCSGPSCQPLSSLG